jgi:hypothetical protein
MRLGLIQLPIQWTQGIQSLEIVNIPLISTRKLRICVVLSLS